MRNCFFIGAMMSVALSPLAVGYESVYVFGDSLSDNGNTSARLGFFSPYTVEPNWNGRFSNGPVWTEHLGAAVGTNFRNYAFGGGQLATGQTTYTEGFFSFDLPNTGYDTGTDDGAQWDLFYGDLGGSYDLSDDLFLVGGGAVNYFSEGETDTSPVGDLIQLMTDLYELGAREFMVSNLPDLGVTPTGLDETEGPLSADLTTYSMNFNAELLLQLSQMANDTDFEGISIYHLDLYTFLNGVINDPTTYGFTDVTSAANEVVGSPTGAGSASDPFWDDYLFFDGQHPTAAAHQQLATFAQSVLSSPIPEPSAALLATLGMVFAFRRARRGTNRTPTADR
jgi:outer membrane lipase/esterase